MGVKLKKKGNTRIVQENGKTSVWFHQTEIVSINDKEITLRTGGHRTATTKNRMNQTAQEYGLGFHVSQKDYEWSISKGGQVIPFDSREIILNR